MLSFIPFGWKYLGVELLHVRRQSLGREKGYQRLRHDNRALLRVGALHSPRRSSICVEIGELSNRFFFSTYTSRYNF